METVVIKRGYRKVYDALGNLVSKMKVSDWEALQKQNELDLGKTPSYFKLED